MSAAQTARHTRDQITALRAEADWLADRNPVRAHRLVEIAALLEAASDIRQRAEALLASIQPEAEN